MKYKQFVKNNATKLKPYWSISYFAIFCLSFILLASNLILAKDQENNLDPTDILESYLNTKQKNIKKSKDINAAPKPIAIKIQTITSSTINYEAKDNSVSNKLLSARITSVENEKSSQSKSELRDLIKQLNSIKVQKSSSIHLGTKNKQIKINSEKKAIPIDSKKLENNEKQNAAKKDIQKESYESFTIDNEGFEESNFEELEKPGRLKAETIKRIKDLIDNPKSFNSFFELGEIMFESNMLDHAYAFYKQALDLTDKNDKENRPWMLFQLANCLRNTDYSKSIEYYKRLITEFPHCPWSEIAKDQIELLSWYINDNPQGLIKKSKILVE